MTADEEKNKEKFLKEIEKEHEIKVLYQNRRFKLVGMPFYNEEALGKKGEFEMKFKMVTGI